MTPQVRMLLRDIERLEAELVEARAVVDRVRALADEWEAEDWRIGSFTSRYEWAYTALAAALEKP